MEAIKNGLARFEKGTKIANGSLVLKHTRVPSHIRTAMSVIYDRLRNNLENEMENGVVFTKAEAEALNLPCAHETGTYFLDRRFDTNKRWIVYYN